MKRNMLIGLTIIFASLGIMAYQMGYLSHEEGNQDLETSFSSLVPSLPPSMNVNDFLQSHPDATQFRMDGETGIDITAPSLGLNKEFPNPYFKSCNYSFLEGKLNSFFCVSDMNEKNLDQSKYFLNAIKVWGRPDQWVIISVGNTFGPAMVWEDDSSLRVVRGVFEDFHPKILVVSVSYQEGRKLTDLGKILEKNKDDERKLEQAKNTIDRLLQEGNQ